MHRHSLGKAQRKDDSELKQISLLVDERSIPSKMVMRRKSEFELRIKMLKHTRRPIVKSTYVLLIVNNYEHSSFSDS